MEKKEAYQQKAEAKLAEWDAEIDRLKAKARAADADAQIVFQDQIEKMESKKGNVESKMDELKSAGEGAWEDIATGVDKALDDLGNAGRLAKERF